MAGPAGCCVVRQQHINGPYLKMHACGLGVHTASCCCVKVDEHVAQLGIVCVEVQRPAGRCHIVREEVEHIVCNGVEVAHGGSASAASGGIPVG